MGTYPLSLAAVSLYQVLHELLKFFGDDHDPAPNALFPS